MDQTQAKSLVTLIPNEDVKEENEENQEFSEQNDAQVDHLYSLFGEDNYVVDDNDNNYS